MTTIAQQLKDLMVRAGELVSATESLATLFEEEGISLKLGDHVARLQALQADIGKRLESAQSDENTARSSYPAGKFIKLTAWSIAEVFGVESIDTRWNKTSQKLAQPPAKGEPPFGMILVCIGPGGIPEDVHVVSVSRMARESRLKESEVMDSLIAGGSLLFNERPSPVS